MQTIKVKRVRPDAVIPRRATSQSAGADLCACIDAPVTLQPGGRASIPTGVAVELAAGTAGFVFGRSGLGIKHGIVPSNAVGVIDADYRGEIIVGLTNHGGADYTIEPGERVAQLVILPVLTPNFIETDELDETGRGAGGFGSTGRG